MSEAENATPRHLGCGKCKQCGEGRYEHCETLERARHRWHTDDLTTCLERALAETEPPPAPVHDELSELEDTLANALKKLHELRARRTPPAST